MKKKIALVILVIVLLLGSIYILTRFMGSTSTGVKDTDKGQQVAKNFIEQVATLKVDKEHLSTDGGTTSMNLIRVNQCLIAEKSMTEAYQKQFSCYTLSGVQNHLFYTNGLVSSYPKDIKLSKVEKNKDFTRYIYSVTVTIEQERQLATDGSSDALAKDVKDYTVSDVRVDIDKNNKVTFSNVKEKLKNACAFWDSKDEVLQ